MNKYTNGSIRWGRIVWLLISDKKFRFHFEELIRYGLLNYEEKRGSFASGAKLFDVYYGDEIYG